jgi:hypothetical protein
MQRNVFFLIKRNTSSLDMAFSHSERLDDEFYLYITGR